MDYTAYTGGSPEADHLCVLVHGLWGNPNHMANIAKSLRAQFSADKLYLLVAKRNSGSFTYDGIELGGERVCAEIEEELRVIEGKGGKITKLSIIGYSLGGLVSRYAVGLLYAKGILDQVECMNFTTFATPHLGVRSPLRGWLSHLWNVLGARALSMSGRQLFTIDRFRETGVPLLSVLADPQSIFMSGLRKFKRHTLYTNITNDRTAPYYTTCITKTDPYKDLSTVKINFLDGYEDVMLDPSYPCVSQPKIRPPATFSSAASSSVVWIKRVPFIVSLVIFAPFGLMALLITSAIQTARSSKRIKLHERGLAGVHIEEYRIPVLIKEIREEVEHAYENLNSSQDQTYLDEDGDERGLDPDSSRIMARERRMSLPAQPTLALAPHQFSMISSLDSLNWRKYPVWIHLHRHSHAALIVRMNKPLFKEGYVVLRHFVTDEFLS